MENILKQLTHEELINTDEEKEQAHLQE